MEFHEKLQELRKQKGLTQEELAESLYVSRTAISKWESGRGYPNIDSLKAIAKFFSVTIDELLSGEEVLTIAEEDQKQKRNCLHIAVCFLSEERDEKDDCSTQIQQSKHHIPENGFLLPLIFLRYGQHLFAGQ